MSQWCLESTPGCITSHFRSFPRKRSLGAPDKEFTIFTMTIMHLVYPKNRLPSRCFQCLLGITVFPRDIDGYFLLLSLKFVFVSLSGSRLVRILSIWVFSCFAFWFRLYLNLVMLSLPNVYFHFEHFYLLVARRYTQVVMFRRLDLTLGFQVLLKFLFGIC